MIIDDIPAGRVGHRGPPDAAPTGGTTRDALALDDRAWAIVPPDRLRRILLVGEGDPYLETALTFLPNTELFGVTPAKYGPGHPSRAVRPDHLRGLPARRAAAHAGPAIAPPESSDLGEVVGTL